jgi:hypothetical protein
VARHHITLHLLTAYAEGESGRVVRWRGLVVLHPPSVLLSTSSHTLSLVQQG